MKKTLLFFVILALLAGSIGVVQASMLLPVSDKAKIHAKAPENSPVISETESGEWELDRLDFIHYAKPERPVKPDKPGKPDKADTCFKLMGVKWNTLPVNYVINPVNPDGLSTEFVQETIKEAAETWDAETGSELFDDNYAVDENASYGTQDFKNAIVFGDYADSNVIGVTSIWFTRRGKQIVEFDMLFNTDFTWGDASVTPAFMDLANIATHELGHAVGMNDIYSDSCSAVTMYGYSDYGETSKRSLEPADITGLEQMYGI